MKFVEGDAGLGNDEAFVSIDLFEGGKHQKGNGEMGG
jgi:hypothetical protein